MRSRFGSKTGRRALGCALFALSTLIGSAGGAEAAQIPWLNTEPISVSVKNQSLSDILHMLAVDNHVPIVLSESVRGSVTGTFLQRPDALFDALTKSYGLSWYYDGHLLYVTAQTENLTRMLPVSAERFPQLRALMQRLGIDGTRLPLHWLAPENAVQVSGPPRYVEHMQELAQLVDGDTVRANAPIEVRVFRLRHAWAKDIDGGADQPPLPGVATLLRQLVGGQPDPALLEAKGRARPNRGSLPLPPVGGAGRAAGHGGLAGEMRDSGDSGDTADLVAALRSNTASPARQGGDVSIEADPRTNAVIVRGPRDKIALCEKLIADLDTPSDLVEIEATIIDVDADQADQFGISARVANLGHFDAGIGQPLLPSATDAAANGLQQLANAGAIPGAGGLLGVPGAMISSIVLGSERRFFSAALNAFVRNGNARVVAKPRVLTLDNTEALLQNQQNFFIRVAGAYDSSVHSVTAGLVMRVTPQISEQDGSARIRLLINIEDGTLSNERVDQIPVVTRKSVNTQAVIRQGDSVLVGGYIVEETLRDRQQVPVLGDLPVIGALFRQKADRSRRAERMFLITPRVVARSGS
ncbi:type III secretion system outer membrane ring subunit SctC [Pseudoduganella lutea]|uniref:EscC/YscC/HrcC family type III secretion system outer membrane ring protein n=1 Tax=Pseudoduganella lutea TaxID=321985 RepID=A0A4V0Z323_9BURK|nr:type III secretion system outer membrane ring subunit SctC [Pseudoduganella lutea]QBE61943.1 EscC/YscC/HrcC family type III secretion system outer membrane ring protein [Pseudoduganella lutea]